MSILTAPGFHTDPGLCSEAPSLPESFALTARCLHGDSVCSAPQDGILFGMVGAYDWGGSVLLWLKEGRHLSPPRMALEDEFPPALQNHAAYLGEQQGLAEAWGVWDTSWYGGEAMPLLLCSYALTSATLLGTPPRPVGIPPILTPSSFPPTPNSVPTSRLLCFLHVFARWTTPLSLRSSSV